MTLPYDYARCSGVQVDGEWRKGCEHCLRRTSPAGPNRQAWLEPLKILVGKCEFLIEAARPGVSK